MDNKIVIPGVDFHVDEKALGFIQKFDWRVQLNNSGSTKYIYTTIKGKKIYLHRFIFGLFGKHQVDHADRDGLNNKTDNLRLCTHQQNKCNAVHKRAKNAFRGIYRKANKWTACIRSNGNRIKVTGLNSDVEAALMYDLLAKKYHGEFAILNFGGSIDHAE